MIAFLCFFVLTIVQSSPILESSTAVKQAKLLLFTETIPYFHQSIPFAIAAIEKLGKANGFTVDTSNNSLPFTDRNLRQYSAVVFLSTTGDVLNEEQQNAFVRFIQSGKGYVGIHAAADTEYGWPWYNRLIGGYFMSHPNQQNATLNIVDRTFIATKHLPRQWQRFDEWYSFQSTYWNNVHVLMTIDENSYIGGEHGKYHPMSWYQDFDGGRSFYTQLSHRDESYSDSLFTQHLLGGIQYAMFCRKT